MFIEIFSGLATLFVIGCVAGWVIEVFFRRFFSAKRWVNPGFMIGPYLPLYGFGVMTIYAIFYCIQILIPDEALSQIGKGIIGIIIVGIAMTLVEFIAGLIFIKGMKIKLWDYSKRKGNIMGIICPTFSLIWLIAGAAFYVLLFTPFYALLVELGKQPYYVIIVGIVLGIMIMDFIISLYYSRELQRFNRDSDIKYEDLKVSFKKSYNFKEKKYHFYGIMDIKSDKDNLKDAVIEFEKSHPEVDILETYDKKEKIKSIKENPFAERKEINKTAKKQKSKK